LLVAVALSGAPASHLHDDGRPADVSTLASWAHGAPTYLLHCVLLT